MLHEMPFASDGNYTRELLIDAINGNLANVVGNLVNRTIGMVNKYFDGIVTNTDINEDIDDEFKQYVLSKKSIIDDKIDN